MLFGGGVTELRSGPSTTRVTSFPEQMVNSDGNINMPFAGQVPAAGRTPQQIEAEVARRVRKVEAPVICVANKTDAMSKGAHTGGFHQLAQAVVVGASVSIALGPRTARPGVRSRPRESGPGMVAGVPDIRTEKSWRS